MALERAPADWTGTIGVEAFDATYGAGFRVAFVDGTLRTEARLTRTDADGDGDVSMGVGGSLGGHHPASRCRQRIGRAAAVEAAARAAGWLPGFASALHGTHGPQ